MIVLKVSTSELRMFLLSDWETALLRMNSDGSTRFILGIGVYDNDGWLGLGAWETYAFFVFDWIYNSLTSSLSSAVFRTVFLSLK